MKTQIKYFVVLIILTGLLALAQGRTQAAEIIVDADGFSPLCLMLLPLLIPMRRQENACISAQPC
ncbi:hypothetical protein KKHLCK_03455 [Candidatus Electrothrix laxa]